MKRVVGLFDDRMEAAQVQQDLVQSGLPAGSIRLVDKAPEQEEKGFWDSLADFFGGGEADIYEEAARRGGTLVIVDAADERADDVADVMQRHDPVDIEHRAGEWRAAGWQPRRHPEHVGEHTIEGEEAIPVAEEQLKVGKRHEERGGVRVYSHVKEVPVEEQVQLRDENVHVERRKVDRPAGADAFEERTIEAHETHEEPVVSKEARIVEEVVINKDVDERTETVRDTVRRTEVNVEELEEDFRKDYERTFANTGYTYDQVRPAYEYGNRLAVDERFEDRDWPVVEPEARRAFEQRNPGKWDTFSPAIRRGYDQTRIRARTHR